MPNPELDDEEANLEALLAAQAREQTPAPPEAATPRPPTVLPPAYGGLDPAALDAARASDSRSRLMSGLGNASTSLLEGLTLQRIARQPDEAPQAEARLLAQDATASKRSQTARAEALKQLELEARDADRDALNADRKARTDVYGRSVDANAAARDAENARKAESDRLRDENEKKRLEQGDKKLKLAELAAAEKARRAKVGKAKKDTSFKDASGLRKEFNALPEVKAFKDVDSSFRTIEKAAATPSAAGDLSMVFAFMKVLDPGSTVREGEFASAARAAGADQRLLGAIEKVQSGQLLTPSQRADFVARAKDLREARKPTFDTAVNMYRGLAERAGASPDDIVALDGGAPKDAAPAKTGQPSGQVRMVGTEGDVVMVDPADVEEFRQNGYN